MKRTVIKIGLIFGFVLVFQGTTIKANLLENIQLALNENVLLLLGAGNLIGVDFTNHLANVPRIQFSHPKIQSCTNQLAKDLANPENPSFILKCGGKEKVKEIADQANEIGKKLKKYKMETCNEHDADTIIKCTDRINEMFFGIMKDSKENFETIWKVIEKLKKGCDEDGATREDFLAFMKSGCKS